MVLIRATHHYGFRYGHSHPWGVIAGVEWYNDRPCYRIEFSEGVTDYWPVHDDSDPYEFKPLVFPDGEGEVICTTHGGFPPTDICTPDCRIV